MRMNVYCYSIQNQTQLDRRFLKFYIFCLPSASAKMFLMNSNEFWMQKAIEAAENAEKIGEIPIGACLIDKNGALVSIAGNLTITNCDPTAHAEILILRHAAKKIGNYRLTETVVYTTIEPCAMCAGALVNARIKRLIFGAHDKRFGAVESVFRLCDASSLNHQIEITSGVLEKECRNLMQNFFRAKRAKSKNLEV